MKCQILFSRKNKKNVISLLFAESAPSVVRMCLFAEEACVQENKYKVTKVVFLLKTGRKSFEYTTKSTGSFRSYLSCQNGLISTKHIHSS